MRRVMAAFLCVTALACQNVEPNAAATGDSTAYALYSTPAADQLIQGQARGDQAAAAGAVARTAAFTWRAPAPSSAMLIRTAHAVITVDSLESALAAVRALSDRLGGLVGDARIETGERQRRVAVLELRVPSDQFDAVLGGLEPVGRVESINVSSQDVGEEFVDVTARVENARRLERRLIDILATRTARLRDVLEVEQALARVREEIERYEGRLRYLRAHVATSSITVTLQEPAPIVGQVGTSVLGQAARQAWRNFVTLLALGVASLGVILPLGAVAAVVWMVLRRRRGRAVVTA